MPTLQIKTESKRPSLTQNILDLYASFHSGGAYDAKGQLVTNGTRNLMVDNFGSGEAQFTIKGFKTKMLEQQSELKMALDPTVITTRMRTSIYGDHSSRRYSA